MIEPWNLREDDARQADSLPTFIIFCEDEVSEPSYFKYFETDKIKVNVFDKKKSKTDNVLRAISHCNKEDLFEYIEGELKLKAEEPYVWCVFDLDKTNVDPHLDTTSFDESILMANRRSIKVAWSNDAFELWILLHFEDIDPCLDINKDRTTYYYRLTEILKNYPNQSDYHQRTAAHPSFDYKKDFKQGKKFTQILMGIIASNVHMAIERAKQLERHHSETNAPFHQKAPCTTVHHLVEELIRLGGKEV